MSNHLPQNTLDVSRLQVLTQRFRSLLAHYSLLQRNYFRWQNGRSALGGIFLGYLAMMAVQERPITSVDVGVLVLFAFLYALTAWRTQAFYRRLPPSLAQVAEANEALIAENRAVGEQARLLQGRLSESPPSRGQSPS